MYKHGISVGFILISLFIGILYYISMPSHCGIDDNNIHTSIDLNKNSKVLSRRHYESKGFAFIVEYQEFHRQLLLTNEGENQRNLVENYLVKNGGREIPIIIDPLQITSKSCDNVLSDLGDFAASWNTEMAMHL